MQKIVAAHQPLYIPWLGYFDKISRVDEFVIVDDVQFTSSGWIRRNSIKAPSGVQTLTVPIREKKILGQIINEVEIDRNNFKWKHNHLSAFKLYYKKSLYFEALIKDIESIYLNDWRYLCDFNIALLKYLLEYLKIKTILLRSSDLGIRGSKTDLIIDICKKTNASDFMLGMGGSTIYADLNKIKSNNINIVYQSFNHPNYPQLWGEFAKNLSVLDLIFNCGHDSDLFLKNKIGVPKEDTKIVNLGLNE